MKQSNKRRKSVSRTKWRQRYLEWKESGISQAEYCKQEGIHSGTFYNWSSFFRKEASQSAIGAHSQIPEFVPVEVCVAEHPKAFCLQYGDFTLRYSGLPTGEQLAQWVSALRSVVC